MAKQQQSPEDQARDDTEFNSLMNAFSSDKEGAVDDVMKEVEEDEEADKADADDEAGDEPDKPEGDEEQKAPADTEEEEPEKEPEPAPKGKKAASKKAATPEPDVVEPSDRDREIQTLRSAAGRTPFLQRQVSEMEKELRALRARDSALKTGSTDATGNVPGVELAPDVQAEIDQLKEVDPVLAATMERMAKSIISRSTQQVTSAFDAFTQADQQAEDQRFLMEQRAELLQRIPTSDQIFATPEWTQWKQSLSPGRRNLAESSYADEVAQAIYAFAHDMQMANPQAYAAPAEADPAIKEVGDARRKKLDSSVDMRSSSAKGIKAFDEDAYFNEMLDKVGKESHI